MTRERMESNWQNPKRRNRFETNLNLPTEIEINTLLGSHLSTFIGQIAVFYRSVYWRLIRVLSSDIFNSICSCVRHFLNWYSFAGHFNLIQVLASINFNSDASDRFIDVLDVTFLAEYVLIQDRGIESSKLSLNMALKRINYKAISI